MGGRHAQEYRYGRAGMGASCYGSGGNRCRVCGGTRETRLSAPSLRSRVVAHRRGAASQQSDGRIIGCATVPGVLVSLLLREKTIRESGRYTRIDCRRHLLKALGYRLCSTSLAIFKKPPENHLFIFRQAIRESPQLLQSLFMPQLPKQINSPTGHGKGEREACRGEDVDSHAQSLLVGTVSRPAGDRSAARASSKSTRDLGAHEMAQRGNRVRHMALRSAGCREV